MHVCVHRKLVIVVSSASFAPFVLLPRRGRSLNTGKRLSQKYVGVYLQIYDKTFSQLLPTVDTTSLLQLFVHFCNLARIYMHPVVMQ